jgi:lysophospholipase L1-like esterase
MLTASVQARDKLGSSIDRFIRAGDFSIRRYAALGDSFSAGLSADGKRWPDELAARLTQRNPAVIYLNVARAGAMSRDVFETQLPQALAFKPDLATVICGANDVLLAQRPDIAGYAGRLSDMVQALRRASPGGAIITATCPNMVGRLPLTARVRERMANAIALLNEATRSVADRLGVPYVEFEATPAQVGADEADAIWCEATGACEERVEAFSRAISKAQVMVKLGA